jgi:type II secretory ATPase GspE/PulE/Tfp pilus assembly ATPase PilB-like protein
LRVLCDKSRLAYIPLERYDVDNEVARSFPREICLRWCVLPFDKMGKTIMVATVNPFNQQAAKDLSEVTKARLIYYLTNPADLIARLKKVFR